MARGNLEAARGHFEESLSILTRLAQAGMLLPAWENDIAWVQGQLRKLAPDT